MNFKQINIVLFVFLGTLLPNILFAQKGIYPPPTLTLVQDSVYADGCVIRFSAPIPTYIQVIEVFADSTRKQKVLQINQFASSCRSSLISVFPLTPGRTYYLQGRYHGIVLIPDDIGRPTNYTDTNNLTFASQPIRVTLPERSIPAMPLWDLQKDISSTNIRVRWQRYLGAAERYIVEAARDSLFRDSVLRQIVTNTEATFTNMRPQTPYFFRVQALNQTGSSMFTPILRERTLLSSVPFSVDSDLPPSFWTAK